MRTPLLLLAFSLVLAGCATNDEPPADDADAAPDADGAQQDQMPVEGEAIQVAVGEGGAGVPPTLYMLAPRTLELIAGKTYNLTLKNDGQVPHDLVIEGLDVAIPSTPGGATSEGVTFTPAAPGTYVMYCTLGMGPTAHKDNGMSGEVVVS